MAAAAATLESSSASVRSTGGGATADSYVGSLISLTSKSEIRYEGILYNIDTEESSIGLRNVRSFGTEGRKKDGPQVPPIDKIYDYILFRGSDIKDLQVKSSPPVQSTPPINSDPAIIQSHYLRPTTSSSSLPTNVSGSFTDLGSQPAQLGNTGSSFPSGLPLYQPGANVGAWAPSPPPQNASGGGLAMPMYWQGYYGAPTGLPQLQQQSLLRPPPGLLMPPPMQQMQFSGYNTSLPAGPSSLPAGPSSLPAGPSSLPAGPSSLPAGPSSFPAGPSSFPAGPSSFPAGPSSLPAGPSNLPEYPSSLAPLATNPLNFTPTSLPASTMPSTLPPIQPVTLASETPSAMLLNKAPVSGIPMNTIGAPLPSASPLTTSGPDVNSVIPPISGKPNGISVPVLSHQPTSQSVTPGAGIFNSSLAETPSLSLVTPGQLLQSGGTAGAVPSVQSSQTEQKDVEVVQVSAKTSPEPPVPHCAEAQPPILPLPQSAHPQKPNGAPYHARQNYRGRGGRGNVMSRPVTNFNEEFDFTAMNEKFKKEEVWGSLGKSSKSKDKEGNDTDEDDDTHVEDDDTHVEDDVELANVGKKPVYSKDDFFDNLSSNALANDSGRMRFSELMKLDTETFGDFSRYRGGRGGRGPGRGGRSRGSYYGRGGYGYGYGYGGRGRGRGVSDRSS